MNEPGVELAMLVPVEFCMTSIYSCMCPYIVSGETDKRAYNIGDLKTACFQDIYGHCHGLGPFVFLSMLNHIDFWTS